MRRSCRHVQAFTQEPCQRTVQRHYSAGVLNGRRATRALIHRQPSLLLRLPSRRLLSGCGHGLGAVGGWEPTFRSSQSLVVRLKCRQPMELLSGEALTAASTSTSSSAYRDMSV